MFCGFLAAVALLGGGARGDIASLVLLRPLAFGVIAYALVHGAWQRRRETMPLTVMLLSLATIMAIQLIPLPPYFWEHLPDRQEIAVLTDILLREPLWRPISMAPPQTLNSLYSLSVPIATVLMLNILTPRKRLMALGVLLVIAAISATLGIIQELAGRSSSLYLYEITNRGSAVGLFSNRNHHAIFLVAMIPVIIFWQIRAGIQLNNFRAALSFSAVCLIMFMLPIIGSRSGFVLGCFAILLSVFLGLFSRRLSGNTKKPSNAKLDWPFLLILLIAIVVPFAAFVSMLAGRATAIDRLFELDAQAELRTQLSPILFNMAERHLIWGSGFGSFERVFYKYEPLATLGPTYLNNAHNDWLQIAIEGGAISLIVVVLGVLAFARALRTAWRIRIKSTQVFLLKYCAALGILIFGIASVADYPLRVPLIMMAFAVFASYVIAPASWVEFSQESTGRRVSVT